MRLVLVLAWALALAQEPCPPPVGQFLSLNGWKYNANRSHTYILNINLADQTKIIVLYTLCCVGLSPY